MKTWVQFWIIGRISLQNLVPRKFIYNFVIADFFCRSIILFTWIIGRFSLPNLNPRKAGKFSEF